jgi:hypothetical protein
MAAARDARVDPAVIGDRRVLFFGDSFVAGVGHPAGSAGSVASSPPRTRRVPA